MVSNEIFLEDLYRLALGWLRDIEQRHMAGCQCHPCRTAREIVRLVEKENTGQLELPFDAAGS